jgi:hypothetical protein
MNRGCERTLTFSEHVKCEFYHQKEDSTTWCKPEDLGHEPFV